MNSNSKKGFTLVEMLIYVAFLAVASVVAITSLFTIIRAFAEVRLLQDINSSASAALERMVREVRAAYDIDTIQSDFNTNPGRLVLLSKDNGGALITLDFHLDNGTLKLYQDGVDQGALTGENIVVDNLEFTSITTANSQGIKIDLQLTGTRGNLSEMKKYNTTAILRGKH